METKKENPEESGYCSCVAYLVQISPYGTKWCLSCGRDIEPEEAAPEPEKTAEGFLMSMHVASKDDYPTFRGYEVLKALKAYAAQEVAAEKERSRKLVEALEKANEWLKEHFVNLPIHQITQKALNEYRKP